MSEGYRTLRFTPQFVDDLIALSKTEQKQTATALKTLDDNDKATSLRVHELQGHLKGISSASASKSVRITFLRLAEGQKLLFTAGHHYGDYAR